MRRKRHISTPTAFELMNKRLPGPEAGQTARLPALEEAQKPGLPAVEPGPRSRRLVQAAGAPLALGGAVIVLGDGHRLVGVLFLCRRLGRVRRQALRRA